jgi:hypothetical protein
MAPDLVKHYGGSATEWLSMSWSVACLFHEAMQPIRPSTMVREYVAVPSPRQAESQPSPKRRPTAVEMRERLQNIGIKVVEVPRG